MMMFGFVALCAANSGFSNFVTVVGNATASAMRIFDLRNDVEERVFLFFERRFSLHATMERKSLTMFDILSRGYFITGPLYHKATLSRGHFIMQTL